MKSVKIGFAPTRRSIFSAPDAVKYANLTRERLKELGVEFVDITDINEEGLFYDEADREKIQEKFRREKRKGNFLPARKLRNGICLCKTGQGNGASGTPLGTAR